MEQEKEIKIVYEMIKIYCHGKHKTKKNNLCEECNQLYEFVKVKRGKCPFQDNKSYCSQCTIHCYRSDPIMRERIKKVMKYAAPRMLFIHPILTISHLNSTIKGKIKHSKKKGEKND